MEEYLCLTVRSRSDESEEAFKSRLTHFWSGFLRQHEATFEKVYAETTRFEKQGAYFTRQYLIETDIADFITDQLRLAQIDHLDVDLDDTYSKYEATSPDWFQIEH